MLFFGVNLAKQLNISEIIVLGDSKHVIYQMNKGIFKGFIKNKRIYDYIRLVTTQMQVSYFHVLRGNNTKMNKLVNLGAKLKMGISNVKGTIIKCCYVP